MDLITNAVASIRVGIEDYEQGSHGRLLAAVRNIHAGILLLYKEALRRASPKGSDEVLLKSKIVPRRNTLGSVEFVGVGKTTVNVRQIKERFKELGITADWDRFFRISTLRNEAEHYFTKANKKALESVISNAFILVRNFINSDLHENPLGLLGENTWQTMLKVSEVYEAERAECEKSLTAVDWESLTLSQGVLRLTCPSCSGSLLRPDGEYNYYEDTMRLQCRICGEEFEASNFVPRAISLALAWEKYLVNDDGAEEPCVTCPECGKESYVMDERRCAWCGHEAQHRCAMCSNTIPPEELVCSPYCGYCAYMMSKDDYSNARAN